mgnify:FL=1
MGAIGFFFYANRPVKSPSRNIETVSEKIDLKNQESPAKSVYRISQNQSRVEFNINEVLNGQPNTVVGTTNQVAGDILLDIESPPNSQIGAVRVNARTLKTDSSQRDGAISRFIIKSDNDNYEFIDFTTTQISGLPEKIIPGEKFNFQIIGDLKVVKTTRQVVFDAVFELTPENNLKGLAQSVVKYTDFGLTIPNVPFVANVEDRVILKIDFLAEKT